MQNELGQPIGESLEWEGAKPPPSVVLKGQYCRIEPLTPAHAEDLFDATQADPDGGNWTYLFEARSKAPLNLNLGPLRPAKAKTRFFMRS